MQRLRGQVCSFHPVGSETQTRVFRLVANSLEGRMCLALVFWERLMETGGSDSAQVSGGSRAHGDGNGDGVEEVGCE